MIRRPRISRMAVLGSGCVLIGVATEVVALYLPWQRWVEVRELEAMWPFVALLIATVLASATAGVLGGWAWSHWRDVGQVGAEVRRVLEDIRQAAHGPCCQHTDGECPVARAQAREIEEWQAKQVRAAATLNGRQTISSLAEADEIYDQGVVR